MNGPMKRRARGFTLIEMIVALSLLAFGLALVFGTLRGASKATENAEATAQRGERLRAVQGFLRTQLSAALPIAFAFDVENGRAIFLRGSERKLEFVATMPGYLARGGPYLQTLELVDGEKGQKLLFKYQMITPDAPLDSEREPAVLLDGIAEGSFEFRTLEESGGPAPWQSEWETRAELPPLLRMNVRFRDENRHWPDFIVALHLGAAPGASAGVPVLATDEHGQATE